VTTQTVRLNHYTQGDPDAPAVLLGGPLGSALSLWDSSADTLARRYHVVRLDARGHGASPAPAGPYSMSQLAADVVAVADELELERFGYVGLSLGSGIGLALALEHPGRLAALVLAGAAPRFGDPTTWHERADLVRSDGLRWLVPTTQERWFTSEFREAHPEVVADVMETFVESSPTGYAACCEALATFDTTDRLAEVTTPTRVVVGDQDPVTPPDAARALAEGIPGADLVVVAGAAHVVNLARPEEFDAAVAGHLDRTLSSG
jgi:3-oxoadipate enol-lactonase